MPMFILKASKTDVVLFSNVILFSSKCPGYQFQQMIIINISAAVGYFKKSDCTFWLLLFIHTMNYNRKYVFAYNNLFLKLYNALIIYYILVVFHPPNPLKFVNFDYSAYNLK